MLIDELMTPSERKLTRWKTPFVKEMMLVLIENKKGYFRGDVRAKDIAIEINKQFKMQGIKTRVTSRDVCRIFRSFGLKPVEKRVGNLRHFRVNDKMVFNLKEYFGLIDETEKEDEAGQSDFHNLMKVISQDGLALLMVKCELDGKISATLTPIKNGIPSVRISGLGYVDACEKLESAYASLKEKLMEEEEGEE